MFTNYETYLITFNNKLSMLSLISFLVYFLHSIKTKWVNKIDSLFYKYSQNCSFMSIIQ